MNELLRTASNDDLDAELSVMMEAERSEEQQSPAVIGLASYVRTCWQAARDSKNEIETDLIKSEKQRIGEYSEEEIAAIREAGGVEIYMLLTEVKCRAIEAWLKDVELPPTGKPWGFGPTPVPELDQDVETLVKQKVAMEAMQYAQEYGEEAVMQAPQLLTERVEQIKQEVKKALERRLKEDNEKLEQYLDDQLTEGQFYPEMSRFIDDFATFNAAFIKGPCVRNMRTLQWQHGQDGRKVPVVGVMPSRFWERVSPYDIYTSPGSKSIQDGFIIERERLRRRALYEMIGVPGYDEDAIRDVLTYYGKGSTDWLWTDQERADMNKQSSTYEDPEASIDCLNFWGSVQGSMLIGWGMTEQEIPDPLQEYDVNVKLIDRYVIMSRLNPHPLGKKPYYGSSFVKKNDTVWGKGPPEIIRDAQRMCNAAARALANNMNIGSGPQTEVHTDRLDALEDAEDIYPMKIWKTRSDRAGSNREAVRFFQPEMHVQELLAIYQFFADQAGEGTVPRYVYGGNDSSGSGAGNTASGLSMLLNASTKTLRDSVRNIDDDIITPLIEDLHLHVLLFDQDKIDGFGDIKIVARASEYLIMQEQLQVRRGEFLAQTNNPVDNSIIGPQGRAAVLREQVKALKMDAEEIVPSAEILMQRMMMMQQAQMTQGQGPSPQDGQPAQLLPNGSRHGGKEGNK